MPAKINLLNKRFGKLLVIEETNERKNKSVVWLCKCDCGNIVKFSTKELRSDGIIQCPNCGHNREVIKRTKEDIIGQKFNHLTILEKTNKQAGGKYLYKCQCDCEKHSIMYITKSDLQSGHTKSCGCNKRKYTIGDIINNRKIIGYAGNINGTYKYICECLLCHKIYNIDASSLSRSYSCGCLNSSVGEEEIKDILKSNNISFIQQYKFEGSLLRYDFAILNNSNKVIRLIEFDGEQHYQKNVKKQGWNNQEHYDYVHKNDLEKNKMAKQHNLPLVRIPYWERYKITLDMLLGNKYVI